MFRKLFESNSQSYLVSQRNWGVGILLNVLKCPKVLQNLLNFQLKGRDVLAGYGQVGMHHMYYMLDEIKKDNKVVSLHPDGCILEYGI